MDTDSNNTFENEFSQNMAAQSPADSAKVSSDTTAGLSTHDPADAYHFWAESSAAAQNYDASVSAASTDGCGSPDTATPAQGYGASGSSASVQGYDTSDYSTSAQSYGAPGSSASAQGYGTSGSSASAQGYGTPYSAAPDYTAYDCGPSGGTIPPAARPQKKKHPFFRKFFACVATAACFGIVAGASFLGTQYAYGKLFPAAADDPLPLPGNTEEPSSTNLPVLAIPTVTLVEPGETDGTDIVSKVVSQTMPAMVSINATISQTFYYFGRPYVEETPGSGSGIIVGVGSNDTDLLIATNYHVIENAKALNVVLADGTKHDVTVKGSDPAADLAIVALPLSDLTQDTLSQIDIAVLGDSDSAQIGQMVIAIGNALGYGRSVTVGYLSAKDREIKLSGSSSSMTLLQTNAAINPGNSGGALLNTAGEVIGINNAKISSTDVEGICFAIPISKATPILKDLMTREILSDEEKGYLGVSLKDLDSSIFSLYNWPEGVYVAEVLPGSPAEAAGIYKGDIITHIDETRVTTSNQMQNAVTSHRAGTEVKVTLERIIGGAFEEYTVTVTLTDKASLNQK